MITKIYRSYTANRFLKKDSRYIGLLKSKKVYVLKRIITDGNFRNVHSGNMTEVKQEARRHLDIKIEKYCKEHPGAKPYGNFIYELNQEMKVVKEE